MLKLRNKNKILVAILIVWCIALSSCLSSPPENGGTLLPTQSLDPITPNSSSTSPAALQTIPPTIQVTQAVPTATFTPSAIKATPTKQLLDETETATPSARIPPGWLVFADLPMRLAIIQTDGKGLRSLLEDVFYPSSPEWSPDGQWIAFIGSPAHGADPQLYLVRPDGSELTQLTFTDGFKNSLSWAPDGQAIVYSQTTGRAEQAEVDLFVYEMDTSSIRQLTDTPDANEFAPAYVPGGEAITFISTYLPDIDKPLIFKPMIMDTVGTNLRVFEVIPMDFGGFAWSPDGSQIVYTSGERLETGLLSCNTDLYKVNRDGSRLRRLTNTPDHDASFSWSSDGAWIAFTRAPCNEAGNPGFEQIYLIHVEGFGLIQLTNEPSLVFEGLSWSPWPPLQTDKTFTITELGADLKLRALSSLSASILDKLAEGEKILVLEGPVEVDEYLWWHVRVESSGVEGWVADNPGWFSEE